MLGGAEQALVTEFSDQSQNVTVSTLKQNTISTPNTSTRPAAPKNKAAGCVQLICDHRRLGATTNFAIESFVFSALEDDRQRELRAHPRKQVREHGRRKRGGGHGGITAYVG